MFIFVQSKINLQWRRVVTRRIVSSNNQSQSPVSKQSQLIGPVLDIEFWTTLKQPTSPTIDAMRPTKRTPHSNSHVHASIWCFFVSSGSTPDSRSALDGWSRLSKCWLERVVIRRCMSSWMSVAVMNPPVARTTGNIHVVLLFRLFAPKFK